MGVATNGILSLVSMTGKTTAAVLVTLSWRAPPCYVEPLMLFFNRSPSCMELSMFSHATCDKITACVCGSRGLQCLECSKECTDT